MALAVSSKAEKRPLAGEEPAVATPERTKRRRVGRHAASKALALGAGAGAGASPASTTTSTALTAAGLQSAGLVLASRGVVAATRATAAPNTDWTVSEATGGRFNDCEPVFARDRKHLLLARDDSVQVYSMSTSSLVRTLHSGPAHGKTCCLRLSSVADNHLYTASSTGEIALWDWTTGARISAVSQKGGILDMAIATATATADAPDTIKDAVFSLNTLSTSSTTLVNVATPNQSGQLVTKPVYRSDKPLRHLQVSPDGKTVVVCGGDQLVVGYTAQNLSDGADTLAYNWLEVQLPVVAVCMDTRVETAPQTPGKKSKFSPVDLVIGDKTGAILLYRDIVGSLIRMGKDPKFKLNPNRFHWHRFAVRSVRWSRDGNYLISGGAENTLVLWQLDTGRKQFLPHLSSHICAMTVSQAGDAYAITLADNSAIVLSTAEMRPTATINGLQLTSATAVAPGPARGDRIAVAPAALIHPLRSEQLLVTVASTPSVSSSTAPSNCLLQTFDIQAGRHISRQALTRTNATVHVMGPAGTELTTPNVSQLQITPDGEWLATVDQWNLYKQDATVSEPATLQSTERSEISLKFWRWNASGREWQLNNRVDAPHFAATTAVRSAPVLDLASNPAVSMFATLGGDSALRVWTPRTRYQPKSGKTQQRQGPDSATKPGHSDLVTWKCHRVVHLEKFTTPRTPAKLAFSPDGSVLAVSWSDKRSKGVVHLIDPHTGAICHSRHGLYAGDIKGLGFVDHRLVILCDRLLVWDIVADQVESVAIPDAAAGSGPASLDLLAVNAAGGNFAIVANGKEGTARSQLVICSPESSTPLFQTQLDHACVALLADSKSSSYVAIDSRSQITRVSSQWDTASTDRIIQSSLSVDGERTRRGLQSLIGKLPGAEQVAPELPETTAALEYNVPEKGLARILDVGPAFVHAGVQQLFRGVVKHFAASA
ncbi:hypothetical protein KEM52_003531 [Ascosphaera acerosa]|nr:hypothetical protein KEM52_003531 [Ascosphaera acerosa]